MSKLFLNMVIHDLRNPTSSIKLGLEDTIHNISNIELIYEGQDEFMKIEAKFNAKIKENIDNFRKLSYQSLKNQDFL
jgi:hypothetical protein